MGFEPDDVLSNDTEIWKQRKLRKRDVGGQSRGVTAEPGPFDPALTQRNRPEPTVNRALRHRSQNAAGTRARRRFLFHDAISFLISAGQAGGSDLH